MNYPGGSAQPDPHAQRVDPLTGQPMHGGQQPPQDYQQSQDYSAPGYQGDVQYPPPTGYQQGKSENGTVKLVVALVGIVAVLSAGGLGLHLWLTDSIEPTAQPVANLPQASSPPPPATSSGSATRTPSSTSRAKPSYLPNVDASIPGGQPVADSRTSVAYDVPGGWKVESPTVLVGFEDENGPRTAMHAVTTYKDEACSGVSGSSRGHAGIMGSPMEDIAPRRAAEAGAKLWATAAAEIPKDDPSVKPEVRRISLDSGRKAWTATATVAPPGDGDCSAPKIKFATVSFKPRGSDGAVLFILYTGQGVPDALPDDVAKKIISTLRPVG